MIDYVKKWLMKQQWRFQYSSTWYSLIMSALNTGALWTIYFKDFLPIPASILVPLISVFYIGGFLFIGWFLDAKMKLWKEGSEIQVERNPFNYDQPTYKEIQWGGRLTRAAWLAWFRYFKKQGIEIPEFTDELKLFIAWQDKWAKTHKITDLCDMSEIYGK